MFAAEVCNRRRFYAVTITPTLLGERAVVREWAGSARRAPVREDWFGTEAEAESTQDRLVFQKARRGYRMSGAANPQ